MRCQWKSLHPTKASLRDYLSAEVRYSRVQSEFGALIKQVSAPKLSLASQEFCLADNASSKFISSATRADKTGSRTW